MFINNKSYTCKEWRLFQKYQFYIFLKFKELCEKYNLRYHLAFGSLIGAVREGGMIPWDDDIDVGMPYEDYKKLIEIMKNKPEGYEDFEFLTRDTYSSPEFRIDFGKFCYNRISCVVEYKDCPNVWIDIFPCFKFTNKILLFIAVNLLRCKFYTRYTNKIKRLIGKIVFITKLYNVGEIMLDNMKYSDNSAYCYIGENKPIDIKKLPPTQGTIKMVFEGLKTNVPKNYDAILKKLFGNYMIKPSEEKRNKHLIIQKIDFGICCHEHVENLLIGEYAKHD